MNIDIDTAILVHKIGYGRYLAPSVILGYLYFHTAKDLHPPEGELSVMMYEQRADIIAHRHQR